MGTLRYTLELSSLDTSTLSPKVEGAIGKALEKGDELPGPVLTNGKSILVPARTRKQAESLRDQFSKLDGVFGPVVLQTDRRPRGKKTKRNDKGP